jgi:transcriptional regulator with XRE-family HTH domain
MKNIKRIRINSELTQMTVEMDTGISQSVLSKYENGELHPTYQNLIILSKYYNVSVDYLMDLTDEKRIYPRKKQQNDEEV